MDDVAFYLFFFASLGRLTFRTNGRASSIDPTLEVVCIFRRTLSKRIETERRRENSSDSWTSDMLNNSSNWIRLRRDDMEAENRSANSTNLSLSFSPVGWCSPNVARLGSVWVKIVPLFCAVDRCIDSFETESRRHIERDGRCPIFPFFWRRLALLKWAVNLNADIFSFIFFVVLKERWKKRILPCK